MTKVLVLGGTGMLGSKVYETLSERFETIGTSRCFSKEFIPMDARDSRRVKDIISSVNADVVVNCIGVLKDETDPITSITVNALFPHLVAKYCRRLIHISTDCVFSGKVGHYSESSIPDPQDLYGRTKLLGEVQQENCLTLRTSFIGREGGLLKWFLDNDGGKVQGYTKTLFSGLTTLALARLIGDLIEDLPDMYGLFHVSGWPISKYDLLVKIRDAMQLGIEVEPYENFYCDRSLNSAFFRAETGYYFPTWDEMIAEL
jgi:dTDP-4-dehydrorhamnose reductase